MGRQNLGPGPGKYLLRSVVGYKDHDISKYRNPQYSMGNKLPYGLKQFGPGPKYTIDKLTSYGKDGYPAYTIKSRQPALVAFQTPGPGTYRPELAPRMMQPRPPQYSISHRHPQLKGYTTPGPNKYEVPTTIGPKVPDKHANAAYSMSNRHFLREHEKSPGPAKYSQIDANIYKQKLPKFTIPPRVYPPDAKSTAPGPKYLIKPGKCAMSGYSFGLRTDTDPYVTADDDMPCVTREKVC